MDINYTLTPNNLHIENSYKVSKWEMSYTLAHIAYTCEIPSKVWCRPLLSLRNEWVCHNFCHQLGLWRSRTKDVDLNADCKIGWLYRLLGGIVWIFVK